MLDFYFFTDTDLLQTQTANEAYGPTTAFGGNDRFRTTSIHTATSTPKAYAVCDAQVLVQEVTNPNSNGPDLVNLILKPLVQPEFEIGFIKYFVYKGILKDSLIDSAIPTQIAARGENALTLKAWENQDKINLLVNRYYNNAPPSGIIFEPPSSVLGINYTASNMGNNHVVDSEIVDKYFNRPAAEIQLLTMKGGKHIGDFQLNKFGFEIIVEKIGYDINFGEIRQFEHFVEVSSLGVGSSSKEEFLHWFKKEKIHCYVDPVAFFGSFYGYELGAYTGGVKAVYSTDDLYDNCLGKYANKNLIYLDIRNDFNYSLNAFGNYGRDIKLALDDNPATSFTIHNYYRSGWPILSLTTLDFGTMTNYSDRNLIRLQLPRGDNSMPVLYLDSVKTPATFPKTIDRSFGFKNKYGGLALDQSNTFLPTICYLAVPFHSTLGVAISIHTKLTLTKQLMNESAQITEKTYLRSLIYLDHLFFPLTLKNQLAEKYPNRSTIFIYNDLKYVDMFRFTGQEFMAKRGIATSANGAITFFAFPHNKAVSNSPIEYAPLPLKNTIINDNTTFMNLVAKNLQCEYQRYNFERNGEFVYVDTLTEQINKQNSKNKYNLDDFISVSFSSQEFQSIEQIIASAGPDLQLDLPISLYFQLQDEFIIPTTEQTYCLEYLVLLCAFFEDTSTGEIKTRFYSTNIHKYQLRSIPSFTNHPLVTPQAEEKPEIGYLL